MAKVSNIDWSKNNSKGSVYKTLYKWRNFSPEQYYETMIWSLQGENFSCILKVFCSLINFPIMDRLTILSCGWKIFARTEKIIIMFHKLIDYQKCKFWCFRVWRTIVYQCKIMLDKSISKFLTWKMLRNTLLVSNWLDQ